MHETEYTESMDEMAYVEGTDELAYFEKIYASTFADVLKLVIIKTSNASIVDDLMQNVYYRFYMRILKKGYSDIASPKAFIFKIAEGELSRHYKKKAFRMAEETDMEAFEEREDDEVHIPQIVETKEMMDDIKEIVLKMPLLSYKSFVLFYYYDLSIASIARQLNISENNVKNRLWRARNEVRKGIKGEYDERP